MVSGITIKRKHPAAIERMAPMEKAKVTL